MSRPAFTRPLLLMALVPFFFVSEASAGIIPWTYNAVFGYGSPWSGAYGYQGYGYPGYSVGYAPDYMAGRTYTAGYAPYYSAGYAPVYSAGYPQAGCAGGCGVSTSYAPSGCGCSPCQNGCSPCSGGCANGDCGVSNYAPSATQEPSPASTDAGTKGTPDSSTQTFRKKELPADEFKPVVPGSDFRSTPPSERDSVVVPSRDNWSGTRGTTDAPPAGLTPATPAAEPNEVVPGGLIRPAPAEPRNDFFNESNEVIPGSTETRHLPAPPVANTSFTPARQRLAIHTSYALPTVSRVPVLHEQAPVTASIAHK